MFYWQVSRNVMGEQKKKKKLKQGGKKAFWMLENYWLALITMSNIHIFK